MLCINTFPETRPNTAFVKMMRNSVEYFSKYEHTYKKELLFQKKKMIKFPKIFFHKNLIVTITKTHTHTQHQPNRSSHFQVIIFHTKINFYLYRFIDYVAKQNTCEQIITDL